jgi:hypothetical protein
MHNPADHSKQNAGHCCPKGGFPSIGNYCKEGTSEKEQDTGKSQMTSIVVPEPLIDIAIDSNYQHHADCNAEGDPVLREFLAKPVPDRPRVRLGWRILLTHGN